MARELRKDRLLKKNYVIYVYEFEKLNNVYVGLTNNMCRRHKEHILSKKEKLINFCISNNIQLSKYKILEKSLNAYEAQVQETYWENIYRNNEWELINIAKTGGLGGGFDKWTTEALQIEANKYKNKIDFFVNDEGAYRSALRRGILDELFKNHDQKNLYKRRTDEELQILANKYETRSQFDKASKKDGPHPGAYRSALRRNLISYFFKDKSKDKKRKQKEYNNIINKKIKISPNINITKKNIIKTS